MVIYSFQRVAAGLSAAATLPHTRFALGRLYREQAIALAARVDANQLARRALSAAAAIPGIFTRRLPGRAQGPVLALDPAAAPRHGERGQALLEFAFVMPIILVFLLVLVDFGIAVDHRDVLQHSVREGARSAAVGNSVGAIQQTVADQSQDLVTTGDVKVSYEPAGGIAAGAVGSNVRVCVNYSYGFTVGSGELLGWLGISLGSIDMSTNASARLEQAVSGAATDASCHS